MRAPLVQPGQQAGDPLLDRVDVPGRDPHRPKVAAARVISPGSGLPALIHSGLQPVQLPPELRGPPVQPPEEGDGLGDDRRIGRVRGPAAVRFVPHDATLWSFARQTAIRRSKR